MKEREGVFHGVRSECDGEGKSMVCAVSVMRGKEHGVRSECDGECKNMVCAVSVMEREHGTV